MNTQKQINHFIAKEFLHDTNKETEIPADLNLIDAGIIDSLGLLRVVVFLEEQFQVVIEPEDMVPENLNSIQAICNMVSPQSTEVF